MVFCPPFRWGTRGGFDLAGDDLPVGEVRPRRETIIMQSDDDAIYGSANGTADLNHRTQVEVRVQTDSGKLNQSNTQMRLTDDSKLTVSTPSTYERSSRSSSRSSLTDYSYPRSNNTSIVANGEAATVSDIVQADRYQTAVVRKDGVISQAIDASKPLQDIKYDKYTKDESSVKQIKDAITANDFLRNIMDDERLNAVVEAMSAQKYSSGSLIIKEGENGSHLFVSARGKFDVIKNGTVVKTFEAGIAFGELAILYKAKRFASVMASTDVKVWTLERRVFQKIMVRSGRQENEDNIRFLASVPILKGIHQIELAKISEFLKREFFASGTTIVRQGDRGNKFYIIRGGVVMVTKRDDNSERRVNALMRGDYFGEQALLHEDRRLATCTAQAPGVECLTLDRGPFTELLGNLKTLKDIRHDDTGNPRQSEVKRQQNLRTTEYDHIELKDLEIVGTLGVGGFGRVELVQYNRDRNKTFALKCLKKIDMVQQQQQEHAYNEKNIMMNCSSPFLCRLYKTFKDNKYIYFLMEPVLGGDVWTILQKHRFFNEAITKFMSACVVEAFEYLHDNKMIYRDLKPENLMLDQNGYVKLVDFGFAKEIMAGNKTWTFAGTPEYVAPEIVLNKGHDRAVDYWALGVFIHELLVGKPPFRSQGSDHMKTYTLILKGVDAVQFHPRITKNAQMIIKKLCRPVPGERLGYLKNGVKDIKSHKWYAGFDWEKLRAMTMKAPLVRPVSSTTDLSNFDKYPKEKLPPDETSGWDINF